MGRPRKDAVQTAQSEDGALAVTATKETQESQNIPAIEQLVGVCNGRTDYPAYNEELEYFYIYSNNIELRKGRIVCPTGLMLNKGVRALVTPCEDNTRYGLLIEGGSRCVHSDVITQLVTAGEEIKVVLNINDNVMFTEQGAFGSRTRFSRIPAGTPIAKVVFL